MKIDQTDILRAKHFVRTMACTFSLILLTGTYALGGCPTNTFLDCIQKEVEPFYNQPTKADFFYGRRNLRIKYRLYLQESNKRLLIILPGRGEPARSYAETVKDFFDIGFSVLVLDHRGQGESERMLEDSEISYVRHFQDYIDDVRFLYDDVVRTHIHDEVYLLGHSMGGAIAAGFVEQNPGLIDKLLLISPMIRVNTDPYPYAVARDIVWAQALIGRGKSYAIGHGPFDEKEYLFDKNRITTSYSRYFLNLKLLIDDPKIRLGGVSNRWALEATRGSHNVFQKAKTIRIPTLIIQSPEDEIVIPQFHKKFCDKIPNCSLIEMKGAKHTILQEIDTIRDACIQKAADFLKPKESKDM